MSGRRTETDRSGSTEGYTASLRLYFLMVTVVVWNVHSGNLT